MPAFGFEEHPIETLNTLLPTAFWLGLSFLLARAQTYSSRQCILLSFADPTASLWDGTWWVYELKDEVPLPLSINYDALRKMHTESFSSRHFSHWGMEAQQGEWAALGVNEAREKGHSSLPLLHGLLPVFPELPVPLLSAPVTLQLWNSSPILISKKNMK